MAKVQWSDNHQTFGTSCLNLLASQIAKFNSNIKWTNRWLGSPCRGCTSKKTEGNSTACMPVEVNHRVEDICVLEHSNRAILFPTLDYFSIKTTDTDKDHFRKVIVCQFMISYGDTKISHTLCIWLCCILSGCCFFFIEALVMPTHLFLLFQFSWQTHTHNVKAFFPSHKGIPMLWICQCHNLQVSSWAQRI